MTQLKPNTVCEVIFCGLFIALIVKTKVCFPQQYVLERLTPDQVKRLFEVRCFALGLGLALR